MLQKAAVKLYGPEVLAPLPKLICYEDFCFITEAAPGGCAWRPQPGDAGFRSAQ